MIEALYCTRSLEAFSSFNTTADEIIRIPKCASRLNGRRSEGLTADLGTKVDQLYSINLIVQVLFIPLLFGNVREYVREGLAKDFLLIRWSCHCGSNQVDAIQMKLSFLTA